MMDIFVLERGNEMGAYLPSEANVGTTESQPHFRGWVPGIPDGLVSRG